MNALSILPDDNPPSMPSLPTQWGGNPATLGRIDHYDLLRKLGGGGFGVVYLARDSVSGVEVAIKTLHPLLKRNAEEMDLLREKFRLVHGLTHPNIAKALVIHLVREINVWDEAAHAELKLSLGDSVMVMDYAPGVTLSKWRRQFPDGIVPFDRALEIGRQVAAALDYAHGERIVHRDVKPGNIMVETLGGASRPGEPPPRLGGDASPHHSLRVRILDFGLAAEIRSSMSRVSTESGDTSGTRPYMAPEQWLGRKQDGRTDQYALACVLYELLSGALPFAGVFETGDPAIMANAVASQTPEEIEELDSAANAMLLRALSKAPKERFPSCGAFVAALAGQGGASRPGEPSRPAGASSPGEPPSQAALEADVLRRKVALARALAAIPADDRKDPEFSRFVSDVELEAEAAKEALDRNRIAAAIACLDRADTILSQLGEALKAREEAERKKIAEAKAEAERKAAAGRARSPSAPHRIDLGSGVSLEMVPCPGVAPDFWMGAFEVTQEQWRRVMGTTPSCFFGKPKNPVESVSWNDCQEFIRKLNALPSAKASGFVFRLPTEAEWETACRAGAPKSEDYCLMKGGEQIKASTLSKVARFNKSWSDGPGAVGSFQPNAWGLYDMHGNVCEWTDTAVHDFRVVYRGGCYNDSANFCTAGTWYSFRPDFREGFLGFRLAASGRAAAK